MLIPAKAVGLRTTENRHLCEEQLTKETYVLPKLWVYIQQSCWRTDKKGITNFKGLLTPLMLEPIIGITFSSDTEGSAVEQKTIGNDRGSSSILCDT